MKKLFSIILAGLMLCSVMVTGCKPSNDGATNGSTFGPSAYTYATGSGNSISGVYSDGRPTATLVEGVHYSDEIGVYDEESCRESEEVYNKDVFYRNDTWFTCADPATFRCEDETDTENYGKFFLYGTTGVGIFNCYMSDDLVSWEPKAPAYICPLDGWEGLDTWAPEVIWDKNADREAYGLDPDLPGTGVYFIFYTAGPSQNYYYQTDTTRNLELGLAVSAGPYGPFKMWNGVETGATIAGVNYAEAQNYQKYTTYKNEDLADVPHHGRRNNEVTNDDMWFNVPAVRASLDFQYKNKDKAGNWVDPDGNIVDPEQVDNATYIPETAAYMPANDSHSGMVNLDANPFVDPQTGDYYMYFSRGQSGPITAYTDEWGPIYQGQTIYAVKMVGHDWSQVDYSTVSMIIRPHMSFVSQKACDDYYEDAKNFDNSSFKIKVDEVKGATENPFKWEPVNSDTCSSRINEGPHMIYNADCGLYYLSFSAGNYGVNTYASNVVVGYSPMGPFRKLTYEEGGAMLTVDLGRSSDVMSGVGHHSYVQVGDELIINYHRQLDPLGNYHNRGPAIDRVQWVLNNDGLPVMYTNGPSNTIQPIIYGTGQTKYDIISDEVTVTAKGTTNYNDLSYLNDGLIQVHERADLIAPFVKNFQFDDSEITLVFNFGEYRQIAAVMVYQSNDWYTSFDEIARIEMDVVKDGIDGVYIIEHVKYGWDMGEQVESGMMRCASNATAVFEEVACKEVRITIKAPYADPVEIPEIYILGVPKNA